MAAIMMGAAAEQRVEGERPLEIGADVELLGDAHRAVQLDRLFGNEARAFADLGFRARGRAAAGQRFGRSAISAARSAIERASSHCIAMSARRCLITWLADSGRPNWLRILVYSEVGSSRVSMMPTASAPERRHRAVDRGLDRGQGVTRAAAEQGVGRPIARRSARRLQARPPPSRGKSRTASPRVPRGTRNRQSLPALPAAIPMRAETMIWLAAWPSSTAVLRPSSPPAVRCFCCRRPDVGKIKARLTLRMRECQNQRAVGDVRQQRLLLRFRAAFRDQRRADHDGREIWLRHQPAPERLHQDADLDGAAAEPAMGLGDRQRQPAELGELLPELGADNRAVRWRSFGGDRRCRSR